MGIERRIESLEKATSGARHKTVPLEYVRLADLPQETVAGAIRALTDCGAISWQCDGDESVIRPTDEQIEQYVAGLGKG